MSRAQVTEGTNSDALRDLLVTVLRRAASEPVRTWLANAIDAVSADLSPDALGRVFTAAARNVRGVPFNPSADEADRLMRYELASAVRWDAVCAARTALLLAATDDREAEFCAQAVAVLFRSGDNGERAALLGALALLPFPRAYLDTAVDACRTNVVDVFEAIACENAYPSRYFAEPSFNQMVLKALFLGVSVARIVGLRERSNAELVRMVNDYADERRAAGRHVPDDISCIRDAATFGREER